MADIFLSYSTNDETQARMLAARLKSHRISTYFAPPALRIGDPFAEKIKLELKQCKGVLLLLSKSALRSEWVTTEWGAAWALDKRIFPILIDLTPKNLPDRLRNLQCWEISKNIGRVMQEIRGEIKKVRRDSLTGKPRAINEVVKRVSRPFPAEKPRALIFDIDGTVLDEHESFQDRQSDRWRRVIEALFKRGFRFVFISGNDYRKQYPRVLQPLIDWGVASATFCFTDGGSRAFEFHSGSGRFIELVAYSRENRIRTGDKKLILNGFQKEFRKFSQHHDSLRLPSIVPYNRTLDYLEYVIRPIRPSFFNGPHFSNFCVDLRRCWDSLRMSTTFELITNIAYALVIRAHGRSPNVDNDVGRLVNTIFRELLSRTEYREIALPEAEVRGGSVTCQIALKPFNDSQLRSEFRKAMEDRLKASCAAAFDVFTAGRGTIDIQRHGVNKSKAVHFAIQHLKLNPATTVYFGDEFVPFGNDLPVASMNSHRPALMIHVGEVDSTPNDVKEQLVLDGNGPPGTLNYLRMLQFETSL